jgi:thiamine pyrophosphate-dependent acetolactate synthase large subunit-like protein
VVTTVPTTRLDRREVVATLLADRGDALVVTGLGSPTYDVHAAGDHDANYYLWGAMGAAALVGLGLARAQPDRRVVVITGDGEQLMGLGGLATIAAVGPANLDIVVLDNEHYGETGMQTSHTGLGIDLAAVAAALGFADARVVRTTGDVDELVAVHASPATGPRLAVVKVAAEHLPRSMPTRDAVSVKHRFRAWLGMSPT